ncbi:MAG: tRNA pseudouridine(55) synthase TruB [Bacteroidaceae bacterium]|nr:tRNA pseudouridine(55) synthase TruB [Bacteroidaceae bacterium]
MNPQKGEILCFNKPYRWTSFDLVYKVRGKLKQRIHQPRLKVGHAGTLDPLATGVLIVCTGKATKQIDQLQAHTKEYVATLRLGATTPSFDRETSEDATYPTQHITRQLIEETLPRFVGTIMQVPPAYSAVKIDGKRAYDLARKGRTVELKAKPLTIDEIELQDCNLDKHEITIRVVCSKGTYIRALARDIGEALNTGAYLTDLCRTRIGEYKIEDCLDIHQFDHWLDQQTFDQEEEQTNTNS